MSPAVMEHARGRIVTDAPQYRAVRVSLSYDPTADPQAVCFSFPSGREWTFPREVLESGLNAPVRRGDIEIWPCGRVQAVVEFHTRDGVAVVQFDAKTLSRFLRHTYAVAATSPAPVAPPASAQAPAAAPSAPPAPA
ncbi:SsgA family sporulation/cell division regulator [Streptomyces sp. PKU-EA00015]|uniref:SsgA family sporulation/cell division regulator n=1 Tax=Streptomyces sp. PKU-EA00015 TaxID=2748326 RepID=UPI0015A0EF20|nr:SsgA family sporulation/cell division regulator [Streptomyces sp. PKU-EA00015]NWF28058.1 SsgA family sporulation/cell division regulator [Streptomyces sp. PKU-EA00015]